MAELDGITVKVAAEVEDALMKLRKVREEIKSLKSSTVHLRIKEEFDKGTKAAAATAAEVRKLGQEVKKADTNMHGFGSSTRAAFRDIKKGVSGEHGFFGKIFGGGKGIFKNLERGFKDTWTAAKDVGHAISDIGSILMGAAKEGMTLAQSFQQLGTSVMGVVAGLVEMGPAALVVAGVIGGLIVPIGAMVSGLLDATGALTAGAIGIGALAAVAMPAIKSLQSGLSALSAATKNYSDASKNFNIGLANSKTAMSQYRAVLKAADPNLRGAVRLLRDQNLQWQNMTASQRRSVVALSENKDALKAMSPAMKAALTALLAQKQAYDNLTPAQRQFGKSLSAVSREWRAVQRAAQPVITLLLNDLAKLAKDVIPMLTPVINATGQAIHRLLVRADNFVRSEKFKAWVHNLTKEIPGVITQVGNFISKLNGLIGPIVTNKKNVQDLHDTLQTLYNTLRVVINIINWLDNIWNMQVAAVRPVVSAYFTINNALNDMIRLAGAAASALAKIGGGVIGKVAGVLGFETGTPGAPPGWAWTGENGPELTNFKGGETVIPHGPSMAMARGYANGTPGHASAGTMPPIIVNVDGKRLFQIMQGRTLGYNTANNKRTPGGSALGVMANG